MRHTPCGYCPPASSGFLRTQRNAFLNPFFSFSARKKRTVSICQEKKEGTVPTVVLNLTQKSLAFICPLRQTLPPERSLRSARRLSKSSSYTSDIPYAAESKGAPQNQTVTQQSGHSLERKKEQANTELSASAGSTVQRASSDASSGRVQRTDRKVLWSSPFFSYLEPQGNPAQRLPCGEEEGDCGYGAFAAPAEA